MKFYYNLVIHRVPILSSRLDQIFPQPINLPQTNLGFTTKSNLVPIHFLILFLSSTSQLNQPYSCLAAKSRFITSYPFVLCYRELRFPRGIVDYFSNVPCECRFLKILTNDIRFAGFGHDRDLLQDSNWRRFFDPLPRPIPTGARDSEQKTETRRRFSWSMTFSNGQRKTRDKTIRVSFSRADCAIVRYAEL